MRFYNEYSTFLQPKTLLHSFTLSADKRDEFIVPSIQSLFDTPTRPFLQFLSNLSHDANIFYISPTFNLFSNALLSNNFMSGVNTLSALNTDIIADTIMDTRKYTKAEDLRCVLPKYRDIIEFFEVLSINVDNSLYAHLSLPPVKLYYPEPFVASPSFVHEEV